MNINGVNIQKQLVSGEDIQTINNQSILTSGDLYASVGTYSLLKISLGEITNQLCSGSAFGQSTNIVNRILLSPFIFENTFTITGISCVVNTPQASQTIRILVYSNQNSRPFTKLLESTNIGVDTSGKKTYSVSYTFQAGVIYWIGIQSSGNSVTFRSASANTMLPIGLVSTTTPNSLLAYVTAVYTYGSAPSSFSVQDLTATSISYLMYLNI